MRHFLDDACPCLHIDLHVGPTNKKTLSLILSLPPFLPLLPDPLLPATYLTAPLRPSARRRRPAAEPPAEPSQITTPRASSPLPPPPSPSSLSLIFSLLATRT